MPEKEAVKLRRAPTLVLVTALLSDDPCSAEEDLHATAARVYAILLGATARGLASYWRTPDCFREPAVRELLGLAENEVLVALIHLGPPASDPPPKERAPLDDVFTCLAVVRARGVEPPRTEVHRDLNPVRLPDSATPAFPRCRVIGHSAEWSRPSGRRRCEQAPVPNLCSSGET